MDVESGPRLRQLENIKIIIYRNIIYSVLFALQVVSILITFFSILSSTGIITPNNTALCESEYKEHQILQFNLKNDTKNKRLTLTGV